MTQQMTTTPDSTDLVAVVGATGQQGGAATRALLEAGYAVRGLTRDPTSGAADELRRLGAEPVAADLDDPASVTQAFRGAAGVYAMTTFDSADGTEGEKRQGRTIVDAAGEAGVRHLVLSSVGAAERGTGIPHFESKYAVETYLRDSGLPATVVRPVFFMENLLGTAEEDGTLVVTLPMPDGVAVQLVAVADIGRVAAAVMLEESWIGRAIEIGGDTRTGSQMAEAFTAATGRPATYRAQPLDALGDDTDLRAMFAWFTEPDAYRADFETTRQLDPQVLELEQWVRASGFSA